MDPHSRFRCTPLPPPELTDKQAFSFLFSGHLAGFRFGALWVYFVVAGSCDGAVDGIERTPFPSGGTNVQRLDETKKISQKPRERGGVALNLRKFGPIQHIQPQRIPVKLGWTRFSFKETITLKQTKLRLDQM